MFIAIATAVLCFIALGAWAVERSWMGPATILCGIAVIGVLGAAIFAPEYSLSGEALTVVSTFCASGVIGSMIGQLAPITPASPTAVRLQLNAGPFFTTGLVASLVGLFFVFRATDTSPLDVLSISGLAHVAQLVTRQRYLEGLDLPLLYNLANSVVLSYMLLLGLALGMGHKLRWSLLLPILLFWFGNILITTRAPIIFSTSILAFAYVYGRCITDPDFKPVRFIRLRTIAVVIGAGAAVFGLFYTVQVVRFGDYGANGAVDILHHLRRWPFGSFAALSMWWDATAGRSDGTPPLYYTFTGILDNLGLAPRVTGGYDDYVTLAPGEMGNVYTIYRGLIVDLGIFFGPLLLGFFMLLGGVAYRGMRLGRIGYAFLYVAICCFALWSFVISFFSFTSHIAAFAMAPIGLRLFFRPALGLAPAAIVPKTAAPTPAA